MGLVSSPERVIHGMSCRLGTPWDMPGDKKDGPLPYGQARQAVFFLYVILSIEATTDRNIGCD
jgi:hypothetical protein